MDLNGPFSKATGSPSKVCHPWQDNSPAVERLECIPSTRPKTRWSWHPPSWWSSNTHGSLPFVDKFPWETIDFPHLCYFTQSYGSSFRVIAHLMKSLRWVSRHGTCKIWGPTPPTALVEIPVQCWVLSVQQLCPASIDKSLMSIE